MEDVNYEDWLKQKLIEIHEEVKVKAEPIIQELIKLENLKPPKPFWFFNTSENPLIKIEDDERRYLTLDPLRFDSESS